MKKKILLNSAVALLYQVVLIVFHFMERKAVLAFLGVELLGIISTMNSVIAVASLADAGLGTAIIFHLYQLLEEKNYDIINHYLCVYKRLYQCVGILVLFIALIVSPCLPTILSGIVVDWKIYSYFFLIAFNTAGSYFFAYIRSLFMADRNEYVCKLSDSVFNVVFCILRIILLCFTANFYLYFIAKICQTVGTNLLLYYFGRTKYQWVENVPFDKKIFQKLIPDFKNLFGGQLAAYVFNSTDDVIISAFISPLMVGMLSGYTIVTKSLRVFIASIFGSFGVYIGRSLVNTNQERHKVNEVFDTYLIAIYCLTAMAIVPQYVLLQGFVISVWGKECVLSESLVILLLLDQYMYLVQDPCGVLLVADGKFHDSKIADMCAAVVNVVVSLALVFPFGINGVMIGTVLALLVKWILKSYYAICKSLGKGKKEWLSYWVKEGMKVLVVVLGMVCSKSIYGYLFKDMYMIRFLTGGVVSVLIITGLLFLVFGRDHGFKKITMFCSTK